MLAMPNCAFRNCKHFIGRKNDGDEMTERVCCKAFPGKIPDGIAYGKNLHTKPYPGDHGIQFEAAE